MHPIPSCEHLELPQFRLRPSRMEPCYSIIIITVTSLLLFLTHDYRNIIEIKLIGRNPDLKACVCESEFSEGSSHSVQLHVTLIGSQEQIEVGKLFVNYFILPIMSEIFFSPPENLKL